MHMKAARPAHSRSRDSSRQRAARILEQLVDEGLVESPGTPKTRQQQRTVPKPLKGGSISKLVSALRK
jgi:hypothetical protein